ncbi:MAG: hypothetical protein JXB36_07860 [Gammaproteobacteria bacterium]|nr:hypothetical protein [Gammaproteobacteria bacterium]
MTATAAKPEAPRVRGGAAVAYAAVALLAAGALAWLIPNVPQRSWPPPAATPVVVQGEHYRVPPQELRWLETFSTLHFSEGEAGARAVAAAEIDAQLDRVFDGVSLRLPEFVDWYYSLSGEYSRAAMAALAYANLAEPGYVANRAAATLLPDEVWAEGFSELERRAAERLAAHGTRVRADWIAGVTRRLARHRVPAPLPAPQAAEIRRVRLDAMLEHIAERERDSLGTRLSISTAAAGAVAAGPLLWRAAARTTAAGGRAVAARAAARGAARAGTAAAGGAAICSPGGPAAVGCAVVAGAAAWLGTDWALLRVDEQLHRDELEAALEASVAALREQIEADLLSAYDSAIADHYGDVREDIDRAFVPATAGAASAGHPAEAK